MTNTKLIEKLYAIKEMHEIMALIKELEYEERLKLDKKTTNSDKLKNIKKMVKEVENQDVKEDIQHAYLIDDKTFLMTPYMILYLNNKYEFINYKTTTTDFIDRFVDMIEGADTKKQIEVPKVSELKYYYNTQKAKFQAEKKRGSISKKEKFTCIFNCGKGLPAFDVQKMIDVLAIMGDDCKLFNNNETSAIVFQNDNGDKALLMPCRKAHPDDERTVIE